MVELKLTGYCLGCSRAELRLSKIESWRGEKLWTVCCEHEAVCALWQERIEAGGSIIHEFVEDKKRSTGWKEGLGCTSSD